MQIEINSGLIQVVEGDITQQNTKAIVNAANAQLVGGSGVDGAIRRAGGPEITAECDQIRARQGGCPTGQAVLTTGGNLTATYVIHTVGPIWQDGANDEAVLLASCYHTSLTLATKHQIATISFPSISTGIYGYPIQHASKVALSAAADFLGQEETISEIRFVLFGEADFAVYRQALECLTEN